MSEEQKMDVDESAVATTGSQNKKRFEVRFYNYLLYKIYLIIPISG